jgi:predicted permease
MAPLFRLPIRRSIARELDDELAFHLEMRTNELIAQGWSPAAAAVEARRQFGDLDEARAFCRRADGRRENRLMRSEHFSELRQDLRFAIRALRRSPGFTLVAGLTLALGIGANTAIFSVVRGILLRPLSFDDPSRLVLVASTYQGRSFPYTSPANAADWKSGSRSFTSMAVVGDHSAVLTGAGDPLESAGADVSADFFDLLGVRPIAGRLRFTEGEAAWLGPKVVILNERLWRDRFGADPGVVGRMITLDDEQYQVVGVAPTRSGYPKEAMLWFPFTFDPGRLPGSRGAVYLGVIARLKPSVTVAAADADLATVSARLARDYPDLNEGLGTSVVPLQEWIVGSIDRPLWILLGGVGFVLLIACGNVANLLLVRGAARGGELAVRTALGAGRARLVRQLITESMVLALIGAAAGLGLAWLGIRALLAIAPSSLPRLEAVSLDGMVLGFAMALAVVTGLCFGVVPARLITRGDVATSLRDGRAGTRQGGGILRRALVVSEVALAVVLLAGAGLLIRSFRELMLVDPGFRTEGSVSFAITLPTTKYPVGDVRQADFMRSLTERLGELPPVRSVGAAMGIPLTGFRFNFSFQVVGRPAHPAASPTAEVRVATVDFFRTMGIPLVEGRAFTPDDRAGSPRVLVITEAMAKRFFPNEEPIGRRLTIGWGRGDDRLEGEIVGVVADVKDRSLAADVVPQIWAPYDQWPVSGVRVVIHTRGNPRSVVTDATRIVHELDPGLAVAQVMTLDGIVAESVAVPRFYMMLLTVFAFLAIVLSAIGIYGVIAYLVGQRAREIGVRMALGASRAAIVSMVVREGTGLALVGLAIGTVGALALSRLLGALLFGISPHDPVTYLIVGAALVVAATAACWVPARRAARYSPALAMRSE